MTDLTTVAGVLAAASAIITVLWRDHQRADAEDRKRLDAAIDGWREQTAATNRLATAIERQNTRSQRRDDP